MTEFKLAIELVPSTAWFDSLYRYYQEQGKPALWKEIKDEVFLKEGRRCWICGDSSARLEAHEFWEYDDKNHVQTLQAIHHLCGLCHKIKHIGFWCYTEKGRGILEKSGLSYKDLEDHFCKINNCSSEEFEIHQEEAFRIHKERSEHKWTQILGKYEPK